MTITEALIYGLVQGVTEYLPVSSSAHLILLPKFLHVQDPGLAFDVFLHLGTLFATTLYFRRDWKELLAPSKIPASLMTQAPGVSLRTLAIATLPALALGAVLHNAIEDTFRGAGIIVVTQIVGGLLLYGLDRACKVDTTLQQITQKKALGIGFFQCLSLFPGMSRSGSSMSGARFFGLDRASAARFSFLMSMPITAAAVLFELRKFDELLHGPVGLAPLLVAGISSFIFGWLTIDVLLKALRKIDFLGFAIYRVALALAVYLIFRPF